MNCLKYLRLSIFHPSGLVCQVGVHSSAPRIPTITRSRKRPSRKDKPNRALHSSTDNTFECWKQRNQQTKVTIFTTGRYREPHKTKKYKCDTTHRKMYRQHSTPYPVPSRMPPPPIPEAYPVGVASQGSITIVAADMPANKRRPARPRESTETTTETTPTPTPTTTSTPPTPTATAHLWRGAQVGSEVLPDLRSVIERHAELQQREVVFSIDLLQLLANPRSHRGRHPGPGNQEKKDN